MISIKENKVFKFIYKLIKLIIYLLIISIIFIIVMQRIS